MQEALDGAFRRFLEEEYQVVSARSRMDRLQPGGRGFYDVAAAMLKDEEIGDEAIGAEPSTNVRVSDPVIIVFQHPAFISDESGKTRPGSLDIRARVHLKTDALIDFPDYVRKPGIVILAEFSGPYDENFSDFQRMFAIAEDGDTINHKGKFVTDQEMDQVASILSGLRTS